MRWRRALSAEFSVLALMAGIVGAALVASPAAAQASPRVNVSPSANAGDSHEWPAGANLLLTVEDPATTESPDYTHAAALIADAEGSFEFQIDPTTFQIAAGQTLTVVVDGDPTTSAVHVVQSLTLDAVDYRADTVSGTADPGAAVGVWGDREYLTVNADGNGDWTADFSATGLKEWHYVEAQVHEGGGMTFETAAQPPPRFRPDNWIRRGATGRWVGNNVYNRTGIRQTRTATVRRLGRVDFYVRVQNDGNRTDSFRVVGSRHGRRFAVRYYQNRRDITPAVKAGTHRIRNLPPERYATIRVRVTARRPARPGHQKTVLVTSRSLTRTTIRDTARAIVTRR